jgi:O-antigen/teichoic acid export membrane protein
MKDNTRLVVNTLAHNIRTLINIVLSLCSTRLVLQALGKEDYGLYMLVAGVVSLLSYLTSALVATTQRHLSYSNGQGDMEASKKVFANSYMLHLLVGISLAVICIALIPVIFDTHFLNIDDTKIAVAKILFLFVVVSVSFSMLASPFRALLISHENIVYISIIDVLDGVLKLSLVFLLFLFDDNRLVLYSVIIASVMLFNLLALAGYSHYKYEECCLVPHVRMWDAEIQKKLLSFAVWTLYSTLCVFGRMQGVAIVLNRAFGTIINAAYGISGQVLGSVAFLSQAIMNAVSPQIVKAAGAGDSKRMLFLSAMASKYCVFLLALVVIPLVYEMPQILKLWLKDVPDHAVLFCDIMLITSLCDQITCGLHVACQALGKIRNYSLLIYTVKLLTVPAVWLGLKMGYSLDAVMYSFILFELLSAALRVPFLVRFANLQIRIFARLVFARVILPVLCMLVVSYGMTHLLPAFPFRFVVTLLVNAGVSFIVIWFFGIDTPEQDYVKNAMQTVGKKFSKH